LLKVIIIDDEPLVRLGLKSVINWEEHGYQIVGEANNGQQGSELILKYQPDIVITDIKMPVMDGLEMMRMVFTANCHPAFIILSSYNDFQLVKQAMKQGAEDYLMKLDLEPELLLKVLATIHEKIISAENGAQHSKRWENGIRENINMLREGFFKRIISRPIHDCNEIKQQISYLGIDLDEACLAGVMIRVNQLDLLEKYAPNEFRSFELSLLNTINEIINDVFKGYTYSWNQGEFFVIISSDKMLDEAAFCAKAEAMSERIVSMLKLYFNINVSVGISNLHQGYLQLYQAHLESYQTVQYCFYWGSKAILFNRELPAQQQTSARIDTSEFKSILPQAIELYDPEMVQTVFETIIINLENTTVSREQAFDVCFQVAYLISGTWLSETVLKEIIHYHNSLFENIVSLKTLAEIIQWLTDLGQGLCRFLAQNDAQKNHHLITKAKKYIAEHYREEISLNDLAAVVNISPGYLSTIFKQDTGICFTDYLTEFKIGEAKKMLRESEYKIYEIAELLGYQNAYYFSKVFKKVTGMTPSDFLGKQF
jgi:two-component system response regulator YesN